MISHLEVVNYRGFARYRVDGLARVNLLVGRNNSGKTSILEAVRLLSIVEDRGVLGRIALDRGEFITSADDSSEVGYAALVFHFFHGHRPNPNESFSIDTDGASLKFVVKEIDQSRFDVVDRWKTTAVIGPSKELLYDPDTTISETYPAFMLSVEGDVPTDWDDAAFLLADNGSLVAEAPPPRRSMTGSRKKTTRLVGPRSLGMASMKALWDAVNIDGRQSEVVESMRILEPKLDDLFFLTAYRSAAGGGTGGIMASYGGRPERLPLGSGGEGMRRLMALSLALVSARQTTLLVDEIDTGLHYSIMGDLWRMVVQTAIRNDVQVFATTHSLDCVRGLAWLCERHPELGAEVSLQKIEPSLEGAVGFDAAGIRIIVDQDIEAR